MMASIASRVLAPGASSTRRPSAALAPGTSLLSLVTTSRNGVIAKRPHCLTFIAMLVLGAPVGASHPPPGGDFRLLEGSPALSPGFTEISLVPILDTAPVGGGWVDGKPESPRQRLLFNSDGTNIFMAYDSITPRRACERVDALAGTGVTTFLLCPNVGQTMAYPSRIAQMFHDDRPADSVRTRIDSLFHRMSASLQTLVRDSVDPVGLILGRAKLLGMEGFLTFRMNELHDVDRPESPLLGEFWKKHPHYRVGGYAGWGAQALNYALPEVRDYIFSLLQEVCERYDLDGLELDFMRFPYYFPYEAGTMGQHADTMTSFVGRVRQMTDALGRKRGRPLLLAARVPSSLKGCATVGLDAPAWCSRKLIDMLTVAPFLSTEVDIPVREFKAVCGDVPVYAGLEYTMGFRMMTREETRGAAAVLLEGGADGICLFNYFIAWDEGLQPDLVVLRDLLSLDLLARTDKLYTLAAPKYPVPNVSLPAQLPLELGAGGWRDLTLLTQESVSPSTLLLRLECASDVRPELFRVSFNGVELPPGVTPSGPQIFPRRVPHRFALVSQSVEFRVPAHLLGRSNIIRVTARDPVIIMWVYLATVHGCGGAVETDSSKP